MTGWIIVLEPEQQAEREPSSGRPGCPSSSCGCAAAPLLFQDTRKLQAQLILFFMHVGTELSITTSVYVWVFPPTNKTQTKARVHR